MAGRARERRTLVASQRAVPGHNCRRAGVRRTRMSYDDEYERQYVARLHAENESFYDNERGRGALDLLQQTFPEPWLYVAELIQNAVDANAGVLRFVTEADTLILEHDGEPLDDRDVRGLCSQALSTKGFGTVGFMGIGFKAVFHAFERAQITSGRWRFALSVPARAGFFGAEVPDFLGAVLPVWDDLASAPTDGMRCRFVLSRRRHGLGSVEADLDRVFQDDRALLALLSLRGVREIHWNADTWLLDRRPFGTRGVLVDAVGDAATGPRQHRWVAFSARYTPSDLGLRRLVEHRRQAASHGDPTEARRERQVTIFCEVAGRDVPVPPSQGRAFALLPTGLLLPLGLHVDAEWLLALTRREPMRLDGDAWHEDILDQLPTLLHEFTGWIASREDLTAEDRSQALEALPDFADESPPGRWLLQDRVKGRLRDLLAGTPFLPGMPDQDGSVRLAPTEARFLPEPLSRGLEDPAVRPAQLFGRKVASSRLLGPRAQSCLRALGLWQELDSADLAVAWDDGRVGRWYEEFSDDDRDERLVAVLAALGELVEDSVSWSTAQLRCLPTNAGTWIARSAATRLPADWAIVPKEIQADLLVHAGPPEGVVRWSIDRAVVQRSPRRHYLDAVQPTPLSDLTQRWWGSLPTDDLKQADIDVVLRFSSWVREKLPQRRGIVRKLLCLDAAGTLLLRDGEQCLLAEPYAGACRRSFFERQPVVTEAYLQDGGSASEWRSFLESGEHSPKGRFSLYWSVDLLDWSELHQRLPQHEIPATRTTGLQVEWRNRTLTPSKFGWVDFQFPQPLIKVLTAPDPSASLSSAAAEWMTEGVGSLSRNAHCQLAYIPLYARGVTERALPERCASWVALLREREWVYTRRGDGPFRPHDVLGTADVARPQAPVADLPGVLLVELQRAGVRFGAAVADVSSTERLRQEGIAAPADRLLVLLQQAITDASTDEQRLRLQQVLEETALFPLPPGRRTPDGKQRVPRSRLVANTGSAYRGELGGWVVAVEAFPQGTSDRMALELVEDFAPLPPTTSGPQALSFLAWVWEAMPEADRWRGAVSLAYGYLREDLPEDPALRRRWGDERRHAKVFTNRRRWVSTAGSVFLDDLQRSASRTIQVGLELATAGHLGEFAEDQVETADLLGLRRLSARFDVEVAPQGALHLPDSWDRGIQAVWRLLTEERARSADGAGTGLPPPVAPVVVRYADIRETVHDRDAQKPVPGRSLRACPREDQLCVAGEPEDFAGDLCELLLDRLGGGIERRIALQVVALLVLLDDESKFSMRVKALYEEWGLGTTLTTLAEVEPPSHPPPAPPQVDSVAIDGSLGVTPQGDRAKSSLAAPTVAGGSSGETASPVQRAGGTYTALRREAELAAHLRALERLRAVGVGATGSDNEGEPTSPDDGPFHGSIEEPYRSAVLHFESQAGRYPVEKARLQEGHDIDSFSHPDGHADRALARRIEVKGRGRGWEGDEVVELSRRQFRDATTRVHETGVPLAEGFDYWLYVVEQIGASQYRVLPIRNPAARAGMFELRGGTWRAAAEETRTIQLGDEAARADPSAPPP